MPADIPSPPAEAVLIRRVRVAAGIGIPEAARRASISVARWSQVENGRETRKGVVRAVRAKPGTIAHMADAVGIDAERLETEGNRPDAAAVLREMGRPHLAAVPSPPDTSRPLPRHALDLFPNLNPPDKAAAERWYRTYEGKIYGAAMTEAENRGVDVEAVLDEMSSDPPRFVPDGTSLFGEGAPEAYWWNGIREQGLPSRKPYSAWRLAQSVAILRVKLDNTQSAESAGAGLAAL